MHKENESNRNNIWAYVGMIYVVLTSKFMITHYKIIENQHINFKKLTNNSKLSNKEQPASRWHSLNFPLKQTTVP